MRAACPPVVAHLDDALLAARPHHVRHTRRRHERGRCEGVVLPAGRGRERRRIALLARHERPRHHERRELRARGPRAVRHRETRERRVDLQPSIEAHGHGPIRQRHVERRLRPFPRAALHDGRERVRLAQRRRAHGRQIRPRAPPQRLHLARSNTGCGHPAPADRGDLRAPVAVQIAARDRDDVALEVAPAVRLRRHERDRRQVRAHLRVDGRLRERVRARRRLRIADGGPHGPRHRVHVRRHAQLSRADLHRQVDERGRVPRARRQPPRRERDHLAVRARARSRRAPPRAPRPPARARFLAARGDRSRARRSSRASAEAASRGLARSRPRPSTRPAPRAEERPGPARPRSPRTTRRASRSPRCPSQAGRLRAAALGETPAVPIPFGCPEAAPAAQSEAAAITTPTPTADRAALIGERRARAPAPGCFVSSSCSRPMRMVG